MENKSGIITPLNLLSVCLILSGLGQWLIYTRAGALFGFLLFLAAVILFIIADKKSAAFKPQTITLKTEIITAAFITAAAVFFRFFNIDKMPPGCFVDEGYIGLDIIDVLNGALPIYIGVPTDNPAVFLYFGAAMFKFFGAGIEQLRLVSAVVGTLTFISFYFLLRYMLGQKTALFGAFIFAVMKWHVWFSRMGLHTIFSVLVFILFIYYAARAYKENKWVYYITAGLLAGFLQYTYTAARLLPFWMAVVLIFMYLKNKEFIIKNLKKITVSALLALAVAAPIIVYAVNNYDTFTRRTKETSIFTKTTFDAHFIGKTIPQVILENAKKTALFFNHTGDMEGRYNTSGQPALDFFTGIFAFLGFGFMFFYVFKAPYFAVLSAFFIIMFPNFITESSPNACRSLMAAPLVIIFASVFISRVLLIINSSVSGILRSVLNGVFMAVIVFTGFINFRAYFITAPADADVQRGFSTGAVKAAEYYLAKDNYDNIFVDVEIWEKRAFDFTAAAAGKPPYKQFELEKTPPGTYILPAHHMVLIDSVFKVLYPHGELIPFYDGDNAAEYSYFAYETGGQTALNHSDKNGLTMKVYQSQDFRSPVMEEKTVPVIFMDRDYGAHSREWTGKIKAPLSGRYTFMVHSVGLSQLYLDGKKAVENQGYGKGRQQSEAVIHLDKGMHDIVVKYTQGMELAKIELWWAVPGEKLKPVSINVLFTENK